MVSLLSPSLQAFLSVARVGTVHGAASELHLRNRKASSRRRPSYCLERWSSHGTTDCSCMVSSARDACVFVSDYQRY